MLHIKILLLLYIMLLEQMLKASRSLPPFPLPPTSIQSLPLRDLILIGEDFFFSKIRDLRRRTRGVSANEASLVEMWCSELF